ncbi:uncharacterized protein [Drosophila virilis]|uniref:Uncharacterized protein n=1 Tax=Drosophila virilis TaxID=7244 RepID=B4LT87_DROVI|nr:uncharacterized protein LOC6629250 [Drosophila virilis]EDW64929.2 uncharacterized protein Dvir_GJ19887 [Drosophila virilis]
MYKFLVRFIFEMLRLNFGLFILAIACQNVELQAAILRATSLRPDNLLTAAKNQSWGMQLFAPKAFLPPGLTTKFVQLFAQGVGHAANTTEGSGDAAKKLEGADDGKGNGAAVGNATEKAVAGDEAGKTAEKTGGSDPAAQAAGRSGPGGGAADKPEVVRARSGVGYKTNKHSGEVTVSLPRFIQNEKGDWVYHYWGATYGKVWHDTRFGINKARTVQRLRIDSMAIRSYYPTGPLGLVCLGKTTVYNRPIVLDYLTPRKYWHQIKHRPIWESLRRQITIQGSSEQCHNTDNYPKFRDFQECQMRRNMRMEYLIPKYPLHQKI